jgi:hypothetical protein
MRAYLISLVECEKTTRYSRLASISPDASRSQIPMEGRGWSEMRRWKTLFVGARENWRSRAINLSRLRAGSLTSCQGRADKPPGQGSQKGGRTRDPTRQVPRAHIGGKMLRGWSVGIADFPSQVGSETTHVAGTTRATRQGRRRKTSAPSVNRPISRSARPPTEDSKIPSTKHSCT